MCKDILLYRLERLNMGKTALIIGSSKGIGAEIARVLYNDGYSVAITYNKSRKEAKDLSKELGKCPCFHCDINDFNEMQVLYETAVKELGGLDVVVNCAGIAYSGLLQDMKEKDIRDVINTDLVGTIFSTRYAAAYMVRNHKGTILNISSMWGVRGASCEAVYSAAKGGIISFTKAMAKELAPSNIRVNCISPGVIRTDMLDIYTEDDLKALEDETPLSRLGQTGDIAKAVRFLVSDDADFITGQNIIIDGGFIL